MDVRQVTDSHTVVSALRTYFPLSNKEKTKKSGPSNLYATAERSQVGRSEGKERVAWCGDDGITACL
jgi:hypothetical protein